MEGFDYKMRFFGARFRSKLENFGAKGVSGNFLRLI